MCMYVCISIYMYISYLVHCQYIIRLGIIITVIIHNQKTITFFSLKHCKVDHTVKKINKNKQNTAKPHLKLLVPPLYYTHVLWDIMQQSPCYGL